MKKKNTRSRRGGRRRFRPGAPPGFIHPDPKARPSVVQVISYGPDDFQVQDGVDLAGVKNALGQRPVTWIIVQGLGNTQLLTGLGKAFGIHHLTLEDIVNTNQRPKFEENEEYDFVVLRIPTSKVSRTSRQLSLLVGKDFVLTFLERPAACLDHVRERIQNETTRLRHSGADYLAYAILDVVIDEHFPRLEHFDDQLEDLEAEVLAGSNRRALEELHEISRNLLAYRQTIWPLREVLTEMMHEETQLLSPSTLTHLRDCRDHVMQLMDMIDDYREICSGLMDLYLSMTSHRLNEIMKVLTIIATIFIPLSFIAGVYGMNFDRTASRWNMPELGWWFGYPTVIGIMLAVALGMLLFFHRRGWLGGGGKKSGPRS